MTAKRSALGRGLDALLPGPRPAASPSAATGAPLGEAPAQEPPAAGLVELPIASIVPNPEQPRRHFDAEALETLAESIGRHGLLQPVVVRRVVGSEPARYELVVGERRWRAAKRAGLARIPATVQDIAPRALLEVALVENVQRRDLNAIELALAFRALTEGGLSQDEVGKRVGMDRSSVSNHMRLLDLDASLQQDVERRVISLGHAKALLQLESPERRRSLRDRIVAGGLSVRAAEELARTLAGTRRPARRRTPRAAEGNDPDTQQLVDSLRDSLKTRVRISGTAARGRIEIEFYGPEELHRISRVLLEGPGPY